MANPLVVTNTSQSVSLTSYQLETFNQLITPYESHPLLPQATKIATLIVRLPGDLKGQQYLFHKIMSVKLTILKEQNDIVATREFSKQLSLQNEQQKEKILETQAQIEEGCKNHELDRLKGIANIVDTQEKISNFYESEKERKKTETAESKEQTQLKEKEIAKLTQELQAQKAYTASLRSQLG